MLRTSEPRMADISIHAPREGGDGAGNRSISAAVNFNPRPPRGGRRSPQSCRLLPHRFQSTPPARGATSGPGPRCRRPSDFNPRPPRGGRRWPAPDSPGSRYFNPRPPRGGRRGCRATESRHRHFNPRPPRGGRRQKRRDDVNALRFQSTPPARGATQYLRRC